MIATPTPCRPASTPRRSSVANHTGTSSASPSRRRWCAKASRATSRTWRASFTPGAGDKSRRRRAPNDQVEHPGEPAVNRLDLNPGPTDHVGRPPVEVIGLESDEQRVEDVLDERDGQKVAPHVLKENHPAARFRDSDPLPNRALGTWNRAK